MKTDFYKSLDNLTNKGIDFNKDFFELRSDDLHEINKQRETDGYKYESATGRSTLRCYYYKLQRLFNKL